MPQLVICNVLLVLQVNKRPVPLGPFNFMENKNMGVDAGTMENRSKSMLCLGWFYYFMDPQLIYLQIMVNRFKVSRTQLSSDKLRRHLIQCYLHFTVTYKSRLYLKIVSVSMKQIEPHCKLLRHQLWDEKLRLQPWLLIKLLPTSHRRGT